MKTASRFFFPLLCGSVLVFSSLAQAVFPTLHLKPVVFAQFHAPTAIVAANDGSGRVFVCDQPGRIYIIKNGMMLPTPFLDISNTAADVSHRKVLGLGGTFGTNYDERGLLGLAFHPGYANPLSPGYRKFYLNYNKTYQAGTDPGPPNVGDPTNCTTVIAEFQSTAANPDLADPLSERKILLYTQPQSNHNGGNMIFGTDGTLYIGSGDGGSSNDNNAGHTGGSGSRPTNNLGNSQDKTNYLGKIHRINPLDPDGAGPLAYSIPSDNPFFSEPTPNLKKEIFAFGIRNPWGLSFDNRPGGTGRLICADVGQGRVEEVNIITSGGNFGWRYLEGTEMPSFSSGSPTNPMPHPGGTLIGPIAQYAHPGASVADPANPGFNLPQLGLSITGGFVYRGSAIPALQGKYVFADYGATSGAASGRFMGLEETAPGSGVFTLTNALPLTGPNPTALRVLCLGEDDDGEVYVGGKITFGVHALHTGLMNGSVWKITLPPAVVNTTTVEPAKDNSIFADFGPLGEELSNGTGNLFAGRTGAGINRRALLKFDVSAIPAGSTIVSASLQLTVNAVDAATSQNFNLHKLREDWGEGASFNATGPAFALNNDATWDNRFYNQADPPSSTPWTFATNMPYWNTDFSITGNSASAVSPVIGTGNYSWAHQLHVDVRSWIVDPASNYGWILVGNEATTSTAKQFDSRESGSTVRPKLTILHVPPSNYEAWLAAHFLTSPVGTFIDPNGDLDGDGHKNQIEYAYAFSPHGFNAAGTDNFTTAMTPAAGGSTDFTITFRRDANATDLTYSLQTSSDLINWTTIAQSAGGAAAAGQNGGIVQSDAVLSGSIRLVTALQNLPAGSNGKKFVRLQVDRVF